MVKFNNSYSVEIRKSQGTGSYPLFPHGWHLEILLKVKKNPLMGPYRRKDSSPYSEHDGLKRHEGDRRGEIKS